MKEFEEEDRKGFQRQDGSGRSPSSTGAENIAIVRDLIEDNNMLSSLAISRMTNIEGTAVRRMVHRDLGKLSLCSRSVPKQRRVECCQEMQIVLSMQTTKQ